MLELQTLPSSCASRRSDPTCARCDARPHSVCGALSPENLLKLDALAEGMTYSPGQTLVHEGDAADHLFNVS